MELDENAKENVWMETIRSMTEKDILYKDSIDKRIRGIRNRQVISITLSTLVILTLGSILFLVMKNLNDLRLLIQTLSIGFSELNK